MSIPINSEVKQILGTHGIWDTELAKVGEGIIILTRDTDIWKQGKDQKIFKDLPELFKSTEYQEINDKSIFLDTFPTSTTNTLMTFDGVNAKLIRANDVKDINLIHSSVYDSSYFIDDLKMYGPSKVSVNKTISYRLEFFSSSLILGNTSFDSEWILPDGSIQYIENDIKMSLSIPNDAELVGETWNIKGRVIDRLTKASSKWVTKDIIIDSSITLGYAGESTLSKSNDETPTITNVSWNDDIHYIGKRYVLKIEVNNPNEDNMVAYTVLADHIDVSIKKVPGYPGIFLIEYPDDWLSNTTVVFDIIVNNIYGEHDQTSISKIVNIP